MSRRIIGAITALLGAIGASAAGCQTCGRQDYRAHLPHHTPAGFVNPVNPNAREGKNHKLNCSRHFLTCGT